MESQLCKFKLHNLPQTLLSYIIYHNKESDMESYIIWKAPHKSPVFYLIISCIFFKGISMESPWMNLHVSLSYIVYHQHTSGSYWICVQVLTYWVKFFFETGQEVCSELQNDQHRARAPLPQNIQNF